MHSGTAMIWGSRTKLPPSGLGTRNTRSEASAAKPAPIRSIGRPAALHRTPRTTRARSVHRCGTGTDPLTGRPSAAIAVGATVTVPIAMATPIGRPVPDLTGPPQPQLIGRRRRSRPERGTQRRRGWRVRSPRRRSGRARSSARDHAQIHVSPRARPSPKATRPTTTSTMTTTANDRAASRALVAGHETGDEIGEQGRRGDCARGGQPERPDRRGQDGGEHEALRSVQLVGGADSDEVSARRGSRRPGCRRLTRSTSCSNAAGRSCRDRDPAAVARRPVRQCARGGLHVICEKPFVADVAEADRVLAAAAAPAGSVAVNHEFREKPIFRALLDAIGEPRRRPTRLLPDLAVDGPRAVGRAGGLAGGDAQPHPVRGRRAPGRPADAALRRSSRARLRAPLERPRRRAARPTPSTSSRSSSPGGRLAQITIDRLCKAGTRYVEVRADCERASLRASHGGRALLQLARSAPRGPASGSTSARAGWPGSSGA